MKYLILIVVIGIIALAACLKKNTPSAVPPLKSQVNQFLIDLFQHHGIEATVQNGVIVFPGQSMMLTGEIVQEIKHPDQLIVQLDVRLKIASGRELVESFAGFGGTREKAEMSALEAFATGSFHVLLASFFGKPDEQVHLEEWTIANQKRRVILGNIMIRGKLPVEQAQNNEWFKIFETKIKAANLSPGPHWIRLYFAQMKNNQMDCEVLLDNQTWEPIQTQMAAFNWPKSENFYTLRVFLVIQDK